MSDGISRVDLIKRIHRLAAEAGEEINKKTLAMDIWMAMNDEHKADVYAMIECMEAEGSPAENILANVLHDCTCVRQIELGFAPVLCGVPRSKDYRHFAREAAK